MGGRGAGIRYSGGVPGAGRQLHCAASGGSRQHCRLCSHTSYTATHWASIGPIQLNRAYAPHKGNYQDLFSDFPDFSDFLGRLQPSTTTIQKTPNALGVEESSSPRRVLHF